jgi:hypothetical protein
MKYAIQLFDETTIIGSNSCSDFDLITEEGRIYQFTGSELATMVEVEGTITHYFDEVWDMIENRKQFAETVLNNRCLEDVLADFGITSSDEKVTVDEINKVIKNVSLFGCRSDEEYDYFTSKQDAKEIE